MLQQTSLFESGKINPEDVSIALRDVLLYVWRDVWASAIRYRKQRLSMFALRRLDMMSTTLSNLIEQGCYVSAPLKVKTTWGTTIDLRMLTAYKDYQGRRKEMCALWLKRAPVTDTSSD